MGGSHLRFRGSEQGKGKTRVGLELGINNTCCKILEESAFWKKERLLYGLTTASKPLYKHILEKQTNANFENIGLENFRIHYQSCLEKSQTIEQLGAKPLLGLIKSLGGWGSDKKSTTSKYNFQDTVGKLSVHNIAPLFSLIATNDKKNSSRYFYQLEEGDLALNRDQLINGALLLNISNNTELKAFKNYITNISELLGGEKNSSQKLAIDIITFQQKIANLSNNEKGEKNDIKFHQMSTFKGLQEKFPFMDWLKLVENQYKFHNISKVISGDESVVISSNSQYFHKLSKFLNETQQSKEGNKTLHNFLIWHVIQDSISSLSKPFRQAKEEFDSKRKMLDLNLLKHPYFLNEGNSLFQIYRNWETKANEYFQNRWNAKAIKVLIVLSKNEIVVPAGILSPPFFYPKETPRSISYGAIGHVLGHELSQGFEDDNKKYDKYGELITDTKLEKQIQEDLGNNLTKEKFELPGLEDKTPKELFTMSFQQSLCMPNKSAFCS
ncbi:DgyrCDS14959 [Dimorphilus gyrociliatus]|uniref:DgyrCDS14959 n=1 Tax=Dimorphilus gyrociliatus TaxID=2664684 RepID=A0A7I8WFU6_9ANNE|nr:DgyrCDS14959 [Dimorphilus gyrociliatus]